MSCPEGPHKATADCFSRLFNEEQREHMAYLANLSAHERAACGWHRVGEPCPSGSCDRKNTATEPQTVKENET